MNTSINLADFGSVIVTLLIFGGILKNAFPALPNRFIPLITLVGGMAMYLTLSGGWHDAKQWAAAFLAAVSATGTHSAVKNSLENNNPAPPPAP